MKKFFTIFCIAFLMLFSINTISVVAQPQTFKQGIYYVNDAKLIINSSYNVKNISHSSNSLLLVIDSNLMIQEFIRFEPNSPEYSIRPLQYDYMIVVLGKGELVFS